jgi:lactoylglutathione lyase
MNRLSDEENNMACVRYVHTNLVAIDWKQLAEFYIKVFGCKPKPPKRDLKGDWLDRLTSLKKAHIKGIHLYLPGYKKDGPTLEIFEYSKKKTKQTPTVNTPGYAHIAFSVKNVKETILKVERNGGGRVGEVVSGDIEGVGSINVGYARDPEGNIIEIQKWEEDLENAGERHHECSKNQIKELERDNSGGITSRWS